MIGTEYTQVPEPNNERKWPEDGSHGKALRLLEAVIDWIGRVACGHPQHANNATQIPNLHSLHPFQQRRVLV